MQPENGETSLKGLLQGMSGNSMQLMQGVVKSTDPLKIQMINDDKLMVGPGNVIVPWHLTDYKTEITAVSWVTGNRSGGSGYPAFASHNHDITGRKQVIVHNSLVVGDTVHVLALNHGKQFYVLDRIGGISAWQA